MKTFYLFKKKTAIILANTLCVVSFLFSNILCMGNWWEPKMPYKLLK